MSKYVLPGFSAESAMKQIIPSLQIIKGSNLDLCLEICEESPKPINCARRCIDLYGTKARAN